MPIICTYKTAPTGGIVAGFLADRIGKRDILAATIIMYSLGSLIAGACVLTADVIYLLLDSPDRAACHFFVLITTTRTQCRSGCHDRCAGLAPNFGVFLFGRAVVGLGVGGEWSIGHALVAESVDDRMRGRASAFLQSGEPIGVVLAALLGYLAMPRVGWRWLMIGLSITGGWVDERTGVRVEFPLPP